MTKPWEITADDIKAWADRYDAAALLPKLVRRLLLATGAVDAIEMRADAGAHLGGWDGVVRAHEERLYCPAGVSAWELSTEAHFRPKLGEDFEKRTAAPGDVEPPLSTYVAVTARRFDKKETWARQKNALRSWADVRVLDADDLATWLEQAPDVALWFAEQLGRPTGACDLKTFLQRWSARTAPPLPSTLVLAGSDRERKAAALRALVQRSSLLPLFVQAETRDEAALFAAAALTAEDAGNAMIERAVIVENADTFAWLTRPRRAHPLLAITAFEAPEVGRAPAAPVKLIVPVDAAASPPGEQTLSLERQPYPALVQGLIDHDWQEREAVRLVEQAGGSLTALQHLGGYFVPPDWARDVPQPELIAFLLMGAWTPTQEADREVVRRLGADPAGLERWCAASMRGPWVEQIQEPGHSPSFGWRALAGAWKALEPALAGQRSWRTEVFTVAKDVLGELNPAFDLPREQRFYAAVQGKVPRFSGPLRGGMATSLVHLALSPAIPDGARWATAVVRSVLDHARGWRIWASLDRLLPLLAEAAPGAFLDALDDSLDSGDGGVAHLFADEGRAGMFGEVLHAGLLWALERLAWLEDFRIVQGSVLALARLAEVDRDGDKQGKVANRPLASLEAILDAAAPQSSTTVEQRLTLLRLLCKRHPEVAWKVLNGSFDILWMPRLTHRGNEPSYQTGGPRGELNQATREDLTRQLKTVVALWLEHAGDDAGRWASALEPARHLPELERTQVLDTLAERAPQIRDTHAKVWSALRERLDVSFRDEHDSDADRAKLKALYDQFEPFDIVLRVAWLFDRGDCLPEPLEGEGAERWDRRQARRRELRRASVEDLLGSEIGWEVLLRLSAHVGLPEYLGEALAESSFGEAMEERLLHHRDIGTLARVTPWFFAVRAYHHGYGSGQMEWVAATLRRLTSLERIEEAAQGAAKLSPQTALWDFLDDAGDPLKTSYWKALRHLFGERSGDELERALRELVRAGRAHLALEAAGSHPEHLSGDLARFVLESLRDQWRRKEEDPHDAGLVSYYVQRLFEVLDRDPPEDLGVVVGLEIPFLSFLERPRSAAKRPLVLGRLLASSPKDFVQLLVWRHKPQQATREAAVLPEQQNAAANAYRVLYAWEGYPGEGLNEAEREEALENWCRTVFELASKEGRGEISVTEVANVLARAPKPGDGHWPCMAARRLLEGRALPALDHRLRIAEYNLRNGRGFHPASSGRDHGIADELRTSAEALRGDFPRTARMLDEMAQSYEEDAGEKELREEQERIRYGERDTPAPPSPAQPSATVDVEPTTTGPVSRIETRNVGPAASLGLDLAPRLNLLTGDNSLGKTFVLDVLFWTLTGAWPPGHAMARPDPPGRIHARKGNGAATTPAILARAGGRTVSATYDFRKGDWSRARGASLGPSLVVYARVDGGFSVWDPLRNGDQAGGTRTMLPCFHFGRPLGATAFPPLLDTGDTLWEGLRDAHNKPICNGFILDAVQWRDRNRDAFARLKRALEKLSPPGEPIQFDLPKRLPDDSRDHPRLMLSYGSVYAVHASAAVKRALSLAYALVWAVVEMKEAADEMGVEPPDQVVLLIDEIEAHLHPKWQRTILGAVLAAAEGLLPDVQMVATTHSPLVIASAEALFDAERDALFHFGTTDNGATVMVEKVPFLPHGEADAWLTSPIFGLPSTRSVEAEKILQRAANAMNNGKLDRSAAHEINNELKGVLSELDPFWMRWRYIAEKRGWLP